MATSEHLTAITLLGENTVSILDDLCRHVSEATGVEVVANAGPLRPSPPAERAGGADLVWACGYLMCDIIDSGRFDAKIVAAPIFAGQLAAVYHSVLVTANPEVRSLADAGGRVLAINETISWSGHHALVEHLAAHGTDLSMFERVVETGSHVASIERVASGAADLAAIDHTIWTDARTGGRFADVRVIDRTPDRPAPPFAVHERVDPSTRRRLVAGLITTPQDSVAGLAGLLPASRHDYDVMSPPPGRRTRPVDGDIARPKSEK